MAIGYQAGLNTQGFESVAIGVSSGSFEQGFRAVAISSSAGFSQGNEAVAIGYQAGQNSQSARAVAIGVNAGAINQATGSIAIGFQAGYSNQPRNCIAINADVTSLSPSASGCYINPINITAGTTGTNVQYIMYNDVSKEINYVQQVIFAGSRTGGSGSTNPVIINSVRIDTHSAYNTVTGLYTVPIAGYYRLSWYGLGTNSGNSAAGFQVNGVTVGTGAFQVSPIGSTVFQICAMEIVYVSVGDQIRVYWSATGGVNNSFCINKL